MAVSHEGLFDLFVANSSLLTDIVSALEQAIPFCCFDQMMKFCHCEILTFGFYQIQQILEVVKFKVFVARENAHRQVTCSFVVMF